MIESNKVQKILYGGDYNPEQWPEDTWEEDMHLLKLAHIDIVTLNVFSWAALQPSEDTYCFDKLDNRAYALFKRTAHLARDGGVKKCKRGACIADHAGKNGGKRCRAAAFGIERERAVYGIL